MGWMRTLFLGDIGNRLDIADTEQSIDMLRRSQSRARREIAAKEQTLTTLRDEVARQRLAIEALTRYLVDTKVVDPEAFGTFIDAIDAEDGVLDGKLKARQ